MPELLDADLYRALLVFFFQMWLVMLAAYLAIDLLGGR